MSTPLCLACASTLLAKPNDSDSSPFLTSCCRRPICEHCLSKNPRLKEYDPCLACLTGVEVAKSRKESSRVDNKAYKTPETRDREREQSQFVLGDDEEEDEVPDSASFASRDVVKEAEMITEAWAGAAADLEAKREVNGKSPSKTPSRREPAPAKYWVKPRDTLQGIAMRYGVNARQICQLNSLHTSALSTAPQLLHTRSFLILPPTSREPSPEREEDIRRREEKEKERAQKRFQFVTKEVDRRIARTYLSLAEDDADERNRKAKELPSLRRRPRALNDPFKASSLAAEVQEGAVDQYLDDLEWEEQERRAGREPRIQEFPFAGPSKPAMKARATPVGEKGGGWFARIRF